MQLNLFKYFVSILLPLAICCQVSPTRNPSGAPLVRAAQDPKEPEKTSPVLMNSVKIGCADGEREGFLDESIYPDIAACSGAWSIPGAHTEVPELAPACKGLQTFNTLDPRCARKAGDDGEFLRGEGCNVADLCAEGWHVCKSAAEVKRNSPTGCVGSVDTQAEPLFFLSRQSTNGCGICADGVRTDKDCNATACTPGCAQTANISNDIFGCGNFGGTGNCGPLDRFSHNLCEALSGSTWQCNESETSDDNGLCEAYTIQKTGPAFGGVLCCRDEISP